MGSYEVSSEQAVQSAIRLIKEGHVHAVKLEGGVNMAPTIKRITTAGIPVLAHIGLTPQRQNALGGFRVQGKSTSSALRLLADAKAVQEAGAFGVVLEAVPAEVAALVTKELHIPTIGIGAGAGCSGQVLVQIEWPAISRRVGKSPNSSNNLATSGRRWPGLSIRIVSKSRSAHTRRPSTLILCPRRSLRSLNAA